MSISFSSECFRTKASRNFSVEDVDLITADLLAAILESALDLQTACQSRNQGVPCPTECQIAQLAKVDLEILKSLFIT